VLLFRHSEGDQQNGKSLGITHRFVCTKSQHKVFLPWHSISLPQQSTLIASFCPTLQDPTFEIPFGDRMGIGKQKLDRYVTVSFVPVCCSSPQKLDVYCSYCSQIFLLFKCRVSRNISFSKIFHGKSSQEIFGKLKLKSLPFARRFDYRSKPNVDLVLWLRNVWNLLAPLVMSCVGLVVVECLTYI